MGSDVHFNTFIPHCPHLSVQPSSPQGSLPPLRPRLLDVIDTVNSRFHRRESVLCALPAEKALPPLPLDWANSSGGYVALWNLKCQ